MGFLVPLKYWKRTQGCFLDVGTVGLVSWRKDIVYKHGAVIWHLLEFWVVYRTRWLTRGGVARWPWATCRVCSWSLA